MTFWMDQMKKERNQNNEMYNLFLPDEFHGGIIWSGFFVSWHINLLGLFNAKPMEQKMEPFNP